MTKQRIYIDKEELYDLCVNKHMTIFELMKYYNVSKNTISRRCKQYNIDKLQIYNNLRRENKLNKKPKTRKKSGPKIKTIEELLLFVNDYEGTVNLNILSKDSLKILYVDERFNKEIIAKFYNTKSSTIKRLCDKYDLRLRKVNKLCFTVEKFIQKAEKIHGNKYDYSEVKYKNTYNDIKIYCKKCKQYFIQNPAHHLSGCGCPRCNSSKGENRIALYLHTNKVTYIKEKRFKECKDKNPLPFDFYLPDYNICIEFQGKQHYEPVNFFIKHQKDSFELRLLHDKIKRDYCKEHNIKLVEIKYDENIEKRLEMELFSQK